jgi:hypothetical protein
MLASRASSTLGDLLKAGAQKPATSKPPAPKLSDDEGPGRALGCAFCRQPITTTAAAIQIAGSHEHVFVNPDNDVFRIGCFADASGLKKYGSSTMEFTWFAGYSWQVELCAQCREQLGWLYRSSGRMFHGLILDNLVEIEEE